MASAHFIELLFSFHVVDINDDILHFLLWLAIKINLVHDFTFARNKFQDFVSLSFIVIQPLSMKDSISLL